MSKLRSRKPHKLPAERPTGILGRRKYPVSEAELFGVELRRRCGPCILWILGLLAVAYTGGRSLDWLSSLKDTAAIEMNSVQ